MSILRRALERRGADPTLPWGSSYIPTNGQIGLTAAGMPMNDDAALSITTVYACVSILADSVSTLPLNVYKRTTDRSKIPIDPPPLLISDPWPETTPQGFVNQVMVSLALRGNFFGQVVDRDDNGFPTMVRPVHPDQVFAQRDPKTGNRVYRFNGQPVSTDDVLHIPNVTMPGAFIGLNPVEYARSSWALARATEAYGGQFFANSANPSGVITVDEDLTPEEARELRRDWQMMHQGVGNAQYPAVLTGGAEWHQLSISPDDAQFLQTRTFQDGQIAAWFRIPPHMLGQVDRTTSWGTGIEQQEIGFVRNTLLPYLARIEQHLSKLLPPSQVARFDLSSRLRGDSVQRAQVYTLALNGGWMSVDEIRELEDQPPLPDDQGKVYYRPLNFAGTEAFLDTGHPSTSPTSGGIGGGIANAPDAPPAPPAPGSQFNELQKLLELRALTQEDAMRDLHVHIPEIRMPDITVQAPGVTVNPNVLVDVAPTPINVAPPEVRVEAPQVTVEAAKAPNVIVQNNVEPTPVTVENRVSTPRYATKVVRDRKTGDITGSIQEPITDEDEN